ncbi:hypothetical protein TPA0909_51760 [Streptomyces albus]|nr:hypothetical protein TPA0909_51760 [Streptomyces albus]
MRGVRAHTTYMGPPYRAPVGGRESRGAEDRGPAAARRPGAPAYALSTPTYDSSKYSWTAFSGTRKDLPTRIAGR